MSFVFKKKVLSSIMAATMAAGFAVSQNASAIHLAEDGIGQVLLAPHYRASTSVQGFDTEGYSTEVVITNTRSDVAVKVKVVVRSETNSDELIDFMCYLTPTDVCRFELAEENGAVYLKSKDDSLKVEVPASDSTTPVVDSLSSAKATWASVYPQGLYKNLDEHVRTIRPGLAGQLPKLTRRGHIEIQQVYAVRGVVPGYDKNGLLSQIKIEAGMSKYNLAKIFDTPRTPNDYFTAFHLPIAGGLSLSAVEPKPCATSAGTTAEEQCRDSNAALAPLSPLPVTGAPVIRSTDPEWVQLMGTVTLTSANDRYSYRIPALAGAVGDEVPYSNGYVVPVLSGAAKTSFVNRITALPSSQAMFDGLVISNPQYDTNVAVDSAIGSGFGSRPVGNVYPGIFIASADKIVEIERALAADMVKFDYKNVGEEKTRVIVTFPTRYRHFASDVCGTGVVTLIQNADGTRTNLFTPPFLNNGTIGVTSYMHDDFESVTIPTGIIYSPQPIQVATLTYLVEGNYSMPEWRYSQGWVDIVPVADTGYRTGCPYPGVPMLGFAQKYTNSANGPIRSVLTPASHTPVKQCKENTNDSCSFGYSDATF